MIDRLVLHLDRVSPTLALWLRTIKYRLTGSVEMQAMRRYVRPGDVVLDIGARRGLFTDYLLRLVAPNGMVHAFEPFGENLLALHSLFDRDPFVTIHPIA